MNLAPGSGQSVPSAANSYLLALSRLLDRQIASTAPTLRRATDVCAAAIGSGNIVHLFGVGHSALPVLELFPRYGSYLGFNPVVDPRLLWNGIGVPGGVPGMRYLEDADGYADVLLRSVPIGRGDVLVVFSHSLRGVVVRQAMGYAGARGCPVIAISSSEAVARTPTEDSGEVTRDLPDVLLDTGVPATDALVDVPGAEARLGAGSTVIATAIGLALVCAVGEELLRRGERLIQSVRTGAGLNERDWAFYESFEEQLRHAWSRP